MSPRLLLSIATSAGALFTPHPNLAQAPAELTIPVDECVGIEDGLERLACYERLIEAARAAETARSRTELPAEPRVVDPDSGAERERELPPEIRSIVTALEESRPSSLTVTLENGQTWRQMQSQRYNLRVGHHVRIYATRWGDSYRLSADALNGFIQVERVK